MPIYRAHGEIPAKHLTLMKGPHGQFCMKSS